MNNYVDLISIFTSESLQQERQRNYEFYVKIEAISQTVPELKWHLYLQKEDCDYLLCCKVESGKDVLPSEAQAVAALFECSLLCLREDLYKTDVEVLAYLQGVMEVVLIR